MMELVFESIEDRWERRGLGIGVAEQCMFWHEQTCCLDISLQVASL